MEYVTPLIIPSGQHTFLRERRETNIYWDATMCYTHSHLALTLIVTMWGTIIFSNL